MRELPRRDMLATAAVAGGVLTSASVAMAQTSDQVLQPSRAPGIGGTDPAPHNAIRERQNPDMLNPPAKDFGTKPNPRFSFSQAPMRQTNSGRTPQVTERGLCNSKNTPGLQIRANPRSIREL